MNAATTNEATQRATFHEVASALIDGARAFAYERRGPGAGAPFRVSQTAQTCLAGFGPVSEHVRREQAMKVWIAYLGRCRLSGRVVTERRAGETLEAWDARHAGERADARKRLRAI